MRNLFHPDARELDTLPRLGLGAAAGLAGTMAIQQSMKAAKRWAPETAAPMRGDPGRYMVRQAEEQLPESVQESIPQAAEAAAAKALHLGYGVTAGVLYALLRPRGGNVVTDGLALGMAVWAAGYLGWLPRTGLTPPLGEQTTAQRLGGVVHHALFGIATVAAFDLAEDAVEEL